MSKARKRRWLRLALLVVGIILMLATVSAVRIACYPSPPAGGTRDCAIVLGAAVDGDKPSPVFEGRLEHAVGLFRQGSVRFLVLTGGSGATGEIAESECGRLYLLGHGVPQDRVLIETHSHTTRENLVQAKRVMQENSLATTWVVSDPLHLSRAMAMAKDLAMEADASGTPSTRYRTWTSKAPFLAREVFFSAFYRVFGK